MDLETLNKAVSAWKSTRGEGREALRDALAIRDLENDVIEVLLRLFDDGQFHVLYSLKGIENLVRVTRNALTPETGYLAEDIDVLLDHLTDLFSKMEKEEALRKDREAVASGLSEHIGEGA